MSLEQTSPDSTVGTASDSEVVDLESILGQVTPRTVEIGIVASVLSLGQADLTWSILQHQHSNNVF